MMDVQAFRESTLVPIDFSEESTLALHHALKIAQIIEDSNHSVTALHVVEHAHLPLQALAGVSDAGEIETKLVHVRRQFHSLLSSMRGRYGVGFQTLVVGGKPYRAIVDAATTIKADSIVMGTRGARGWRRLLGTNATRVIQNSPCPVVVVNEFGRSVERYESIVLPLDFTKDTTQKVAWALRVARYYQSTVHILAVREDDDRLARRVEGLMHQVLAYLQKNGVCVEAHQLVSVDRNFAHATVKFAREKNADLIMIMTQQERHADEFLFGTYAQQIVMTSEVPVMCVTPSADMHSFPRTPETSSS
jgi:nucleotide-binding universal stress UspA family protein